MANRAYRGNHMLGRDGFRAHDCPTDSVISCQVVDSLVFHRPLWRWIPYRSNFATG
ncbi:hypothetical protein RHECNPAF_1330077 [Rhizobium etli CNPAF512]|nr:hypothetical protein RHECNPAF_1330077 [Rhizobium etli CNPAF512]